MTTRKVIDYLIRGGIVEDRKQGNSFHRLFINDKNEFNHIHEQLSEIEIVLNNIDKFVEKIPSQITWMDSKNIQKTLQWAFRKPCSFMLLILLLRIKEIQPEKDANLLYTAIGKLMSKASLWQKRDAKNVIGTLDYHKHFLLRHNHIIPRKANDNMKMHLDKIIKNNLIETMENFKKRFVSV